MSENQTPAAKSQAEAAPGEFNFAKPAEENPRMKRRSLKTKPGGLIKPASTPPSAARELEREAPPLSSEQAHAKPRVVEAATVKTASSTQAAPPRTTPSSTASTAASMRPTTNSTTSPHGTRPATLYYSSSQPRKDIEAPSMKSTPSASPASSSSAATASSATRPATASASRPSTPVDYRTNVERQAREQKSVGSLLSYVVYVLIAFFVISACLAGYGAHIIFKQLDDQSVTVSDLDKKYSAANQDLNAKLNATQDTLTSALAQITRQQDLIVKQQEDINRLIATNNDNVNALRAEKAVRAQETSVLRIRLRDLEYRTSTQKF